MTSHELDRPAWASLTSRHQAFADGDAKARRYRPSIVPFAASADDSPESLEALGTLLEPGDTVVLQGTGGVSIFGLQFAARAGLRTLITSSSDAKLERAKALGAHHLVNYRTTPEWSKAVREVTGGVGADFIMEVGGGGTIQESMKAIRIGGHIAVIGIVAGAGEPFNPAALIGNSARLQGLSVGSRDMFEAMCRFIELHGIRPVVDKVYPWTEAKSAIAAMGAGEHFGKIVLEF